LALLCTDVQDGFLGVLQHCLLSSMVNANTSKSNKRQKLNTSTENRRASIRLARLQNPKVSSFDEEKNVPEDTPPADETMGPLPDPAEEKQETSNEEILVGAGPVAPRFRRYIHRAFNRFMHESGLLLRMTDTYIGYADQPYFATLSTQL